MVRTRPCRHAQTCGLTYCTVVRPARLSLLGEPQVEFLVVDADEHIGPPLDDLPAQGAAQPHEARQVREHLGEPHDRQLVDVVPGRAAGGLHLRAGDAGEFGVGEAGGAMPR